MSIKAIIFDLDGTLVRTERLKALSYAKAAVELCPRQITEDEVIAAFREVVGRSRREVAKFLVARFDLEAAARERMAEFGVTAPWQAFVQVRLRHYEAMLADPQVLIDNQWLHNRAVLEEARRANCKVALATMSVCSQTQRVLQVLDLASAFDFVACRVDVEHGKPDPEIYNLVAAELGIDPGFCLVIEDSLSGVKAALAASMWCIAVTTPFTRQSVHGAQVLDQRWIVDDPALLPDVVRQMVAARQLD
jgi:HAD superfamily hydrolase (TIGR01509 family)